VLLLARRTSLGGVVLVLRGIRGRIEEAGLGGGAPLELVVSVARGEKEGAGRKGRLVRWRPGASCASCGCRAGRVAFVLPGAIALAGLLCSFACLSVYAEL
jgi:hypothetical protein